MPKMLKTKNAKNQKYTKRFISHVGRIVVMPAQPTTTYSTKASAKTATNIKHEVSMTLERERERDRETDR